MSDSAFKRSADDSDGRELEETYKNNERSEQ